MIFIIKWFIFYLGVMFAMITDNLCWIPDSPEWISIKENFYIFNLFKKEFGIPKNKIGIIYVINKRIIPVLVDLRDILPAIITSLILYLVL